MYNVFCSELVEHIPISVKLEDVPNITISGISCSEGGILFLADKTRKLIYRLDVQTCSSFSFGEGKLSKSCLLWSLLLFILTLFTLDNPADVAVCHGYLLVLDKNAIHVFSMMGVWLSKWEARFPEETLRMSVLFPYVYVSSVDGVHTFKIVISWTAP